MLPFCLLDQEIATAIVEPLKRRGLLHGLLALLQAVEEMPFKAHHQLSLILAPVPMTDYIIG
jgi:hypothetical protein